MWSFWDLNSHKLPVRVPVFVCICKSWPCWENSIPIISRLCNDCIHNHFMTFISRIRVQTKSYCLTVCATSCRWKSEKPSTVIIMFFVFGSSRRAGCPHGLTGPSCTIAVLWLLQRCKLLLWITTWFFSITIRRTKRLLYGGLPGPLPTCWSSR